MSADRNIFQRVFCFAMLADMVNSQKGDEEELQKGLQEDLAPYMQDGWQLAWGPTIWKFYPSDTNTYIANAVYVVHHPQAEFEDGSVYPTYVIAIAGTPMESKVVLNGEDRAVRAVVDFNAWVKGGIDKSPVTTPFKDVSHGTAYISKGAALGTHALLNAVSSANAFSPGKTLVEFLGALAQSSTTRFIVTGHSLGGLLTTTVGLTLVEAGVLDAGNTLTYAAAGDTAGSIEWALQFANTFPASKSSPLGVSGYQGWNLNLVNDMDCVPNLWCPDEDVSPLQWIGRVPHLYGNCRPIREVEERTAICYSLVAESGVVYKPVPAQRFKSTFAAHVPANFPAFQRTALMQHVVPYLKEVGVTAKECGMIPTEAEDSYKEAGLVAIT